MLPQRGGLRQHIALVESGVVSQPNSPVSTSSHTDQVLELLRKLMEYRSDEVRHRLEKVGRAASMLHVDVLLLIYHFARFSPGNIMEIGPYIGGRAPRPKQSDAGVRNLVRIKSNLCCCGRNPLTTSGFPWTVKTHFYHAHPALCPVRPYKQRAGHSSIPDGSIPLRSILAPYDDTTS